jgi:flagellar biosynthesis/type III secretory pathway M-ring protein FliF/YscJ
METSTVVWIVVAVIVLIALIAVIAKMASKKKHERDRAHASQLRETAATEAGDLQRKEALAKESDAKAAGARAEAERKAAEAERLEAEARDRMGTAAEQRHEHQEHLRKADELDPDVKHPAPTTDGPHDDRATASDDGRAEGDDPARADERHGGSHRRT